MLKNYLKIAFRNIWRNKSYTLINIVGLSTGIAACMLIFLVVNFELSHDRFHKNYHRIYRVAKKAINKQGEINYNPGSPLPLAKALEVDFPQLEKITRIHGAISPQVTVWDNKANRNPGKKFIEEDQGLFVEPSFFKIFDFPWVMGAIKDFNKPYVAVLSKKFADKYFGNWKKAIGNHLKIDNTFQVQVIGILENFPLQTDFPMNLVISYETFKKYPEIYPNLKDFFKEDWGSISSSNQVFVLFPPDLQLKEAQKQLDRFTEKHYKNRRENSKNIHYFNPLSDIHFNREMENFGDRTTSKSTLWTLSLIGFLIILMASINYINLATAQVAGRTKEVGIRKLLGSYRSQLIGQFLGETFFIVLISVLLAINLSELALPFLSKISGVPPAVSLLTDPVMIGFILLITFVVALLAGIYPSLVLSGYQPSQALKSKIQVQNIGGVSLKRTLVVIQFAIAQLLIISTLVAVRQMNYISLLDLGFQKEDVYMLSVQSDPKLKSKLVAFKESLLQIPSVKSVSYANDPPSSDNNWSTNFSFNYRKDAPFETFLKFVDKDYFHTYQLEILAGKVESKNDTLKGYVVNETLVKKLGIKQYSEIIGKKIRLGGGEWITVRAVVKDFKANSAREAIKPIVISSNPTYYFTAGIKIQGKNLPQIVYSIQQLYDKYFPDNAFNGNFLDENIARFYEQESKLKLTYQFFAGLAILVSCLGLYGLISYLVMQKNKEIGIRKVLGANLRHIVALVAGEFFLLICVSFVIIGPLAYYFMNSWLSNFAYRIQIGPGVFFFTLVLSILAAGLTISYKTLKAAMTNPVEALKYE